MYNTITLISQVPLLWYNLTNVIILWCWNTQLVRLNMKICQCSILFNLQPIICNYHFQQENVPTIFMQILYQSIEWNINSWGNKPVSSYLRGIVIDVLNLCGSKEKANFGVFWLWHTSLVGVLHCFCMPITECMWWILCFAILLFASS